MPSTVTLVYDIEQAGPVTISALTAAMSAVPLPTDILFEIGTPRLIADNTTFFGPVVTRTLVYSFTPQYHIMSFPIVSLYREGAVVSSDPNDTLHGTGVQSVRIHTRVLPFTGSLIGETPLTIELDLNGTTPVNFPTFFPEGKLLEFTTIEPIKTGSLGTNAGQINVYTAADARPNYGSLSTFGRNGTEIISQIDQNFTGSLISTNPADTSAGVGAQIVTVTYVDFLNNPGVEVIALDGTTPVNMVNPKAHISNIAVTAVGAENGNLGQITAFNGPNATGGPVGILPPSFFSYFSSTSDYTAPWRNLFTYILSSALSTEVVAHPPLIV